MKQPIRQGTEASSTFSPTARYPYQVFKAIEMPKLQQRTEKGKTVRKAFPIVASSDSTFHTIDGPQHVHGNRLFLRSRQLSVRRRRTSGIRRRHCKPVLAQTSLAPSQRRRRQLPFFPSSFITGLEFVHKKTYRVRH